MSQEWSYWWSHNIDSTWKSWKHPGNPWDFFLRSLKRESWHSSFGIKVFSKTRLTSWQFGSHQYLELELDSPSKLFNKNSKMLNGCRWWFFSNSLFPKGPKFSYGWKKLKPWKFEALASPWRWIKYDSTCANIILDMFVFDARLSSVGLYIYITIYIYIISFLEKSFLVAISCRFTPDTPVTTRIIIYL